MIIILQLQLQQQPQLQYQHNNMEIYEQHRNCLFTFEQINGIQ